LCGARALCKAYRDARERFKAPGEKLTHPTQQNFLDWLKSAAYTNKVTMIMINKEFETQKVADDYSDDLLNTKGGNLHNE
jgi:hypothetical protein